MAIWGPHDSIIPKCCVINLFIFFLSRLFNKILLIKCLRKIILVNLKFSNNSVYTRQDKLIPNMNFTQVRQNSLLIQIINSI